MRDVKATLLDDDMVRLLAIPFSGPIPSPKAKRGVDLDGEYFSERTDIKPHWLKARPVDWHHGEDPTGVMGREVIGKAIEPEMDSEGWWVKLWLDAGSSRLALIRRLSQKGAEIFGSSETIRELSRVNKASGHIDVWPYWRQTLSTSPINTHSVLRPLKASLLDAMHDDAYIPSDAFWADLTAELTDLGVTLRDGEAKADRTPDGDSVLAEALRRLGVAVRSLNTLYRKQ